MISSSSDEAEDSVGSSRDREARGELSDGSEDDDGGDDDIVVVREIPWTEREGAAASGAQGRRHCVLGTVGETIGSHFSS